MRKDLTAQVGNDSFPQPVHKVGSRGTKKPNNQGKDQQNEKIAVYVRGILDRKPMVNNIADSHRHSQQRC